MPSRRRIVTGHTSDGRSTVVSDAAVSPRTSPRLPDVEMLYLRGRDEPARYPDDGTEPAWHQQAKADARAQFVLAGARRDS